MKYPDDFINKIICGDCKDVLKEIPDNSVDSIVTDPPAGIAFMGKTWDDFSQIKTTKSQVVNWMNSGIKFSNKERDNFIDFITEVFIEGLRVLKPGGHTLVWALPRTSHWTGTALENAGFEIRDCVYHLFGSGFPKSRNIGKDIEKLKVGGIKNLEIIGTKKGIKVETGTQGFSYQKEYVPGKSMGGKQVSGDIPVYKINNGWEGWGTALKPAVECWWLCRKPLSENTVAENVLKHGMGGLNIDGCRILTEENLNGGAYVGEGKMKSQFGEWGMKKRNGQYKQPIGRFPANLIHDGSDVILAEFARAGNSKSGQNKTAKGKGGIWQKGNSLPVGPEYGDEGSAARFFYTAKPSASEKNLLYGEFEEKERFMEGNYSQSPTCKTCNLTLNGTNNHDKCSGKVYYKEMKQKKMGNFHPTVKAQSLMQYLIKLITPPKGIVLDMFAGSGSTLLAAKTLGHPFIGIEIDKEYCAIAEGRFKQQVMNF